ncbi:MAG: PAS domain S-box protein [Bacteroidota bacterium]|nr:PAS domain S-box protein [Bacteroidota bacterium]
MITATETLTADNREKLQEYRAALDQNPLSVVLIDSTGTIEYVNPAFERMHGCLAEEVTGKEYSVLRSEYLSEDQYHTIERTILTGREWKGEFQNKRRNGEVYWEYAIVCPIKGDDGAFRNYLILSEDITERKRAEHELIAAKERARRADRIKEAFLGNISHEIRTPLNIILGYAELLQTTMESQEADGGREFLSEMVRASQRLMRTVDDIIHVTRIDVGDYSFEKKRVDIVAEVYQLVMEMMLFAREKNIHLDFTPGCGSLFVEVEPVTFLDAVANLIDNAIKFTREGFVVVDIQKIDDTAVIRVQDTGVGISDSFVEELFTPFSQEESGSQRSFEGLGLGMALTKKYLNLNGAEIAVKSVKGRGTLFTVRLPALE